MDFKRKFGTEINILFLSPNKYFYYFLKNFDSFFCDTYIIFANLNFYFQVSQKTHTHTNKHTHIHTYTHTHTHKHKHTQKRDT